MTEKGIVGVRLPSAVSSKTVNEPINTKLTLLSAAVCAHTFLLALMYTGLADCSPCKGDT